MEVYLIRHADAEPLGESGTSDDASRPLTPVGQEQVRKLGEALREKAIRPGILLSSPLLRARQTAEALAQALGDPAPEVRICDEAAPGGKRRRLSRVLKDLGVESVAVVGHQPDIGTFAAWLVGSKKAEIDIAKSGVACIHCENGPGRLEGSLIWLVTPQWLS